MFYRERLPSGNVVITDDSGNVRIFKSNTDADYFEYNNNADFSWKTKYNEYMIYEELPELTPQEQIEAMFNEVLVTNS